MASSRQVADYVFRAPSALVCVASTLLSNIGHEERILERVQDVSDADRFLFQAMGKKNPAVTILAGFDSIILLSGSRNTVRASMGR